MRAIFADKIEKGRLIGAGHRMSAYATDYGETRGLFTVKGPQGDFLHILVSDGADWKVCCLPGEPWEHVSVSLPDRCPTWQEMCWVKHQFFWPEEWVIQFHPAQEENISYHDFCLHLWRPKNGEFPKPPSICVAPKKGIA
jgi:hypothetical protein